MISDYLVCEGSWRYIQFVSVVPVCILSYKGTVCVLSYKGTVCVLSYKGTVCVLSYKGSVCS